jgi:hypothetical protein
MFMTINQVKAIIHLKSVTQLPMQNLEHFGIARKVITELTSKGLVSQSGRGESTSAVLTPRGFLFFNEFVKLTDKEPVKFGEDGDAFLVRVAKKVRL